MLYVLGESMVLQSLKVGVSWLNLKGDNDS